MVRSVHGYMMQGPGQLEQAFDICFMRRTVVYSTSQNERHLDIRVVIQLLVGTKNVLEGSWDKWGPGSLV